MPMPYSVRQALNAGDDEEHRRLSSKGGKAKARNTRAKKRDAAWQKYCAILSSVERAMAREAIAPSLHEMMLEANEHICPIDPEDPNLTHFP